MPLLARIIFVLQEPHDISNATVILNTLQIHRLVRETEEDGKASISFFWSFLRRWSSLC